MNQKAVQNKRLISAATIYRVAFLVLGIILVGASGMLGGRRPENLGITNGRLADCPAKPNCVSTQATDEGHRMEPVAVDGNVDEVSQRVRNALEAWPRTKIITETDGYFHAECTSAICRFVDDLEIWFDEEAGVVHARSASRLGYSDLGANRKRVERLFAELAGG